MVEFNEDRTVMSIGDDEARGGVTGHNVRYVLAAGLGMVIVCFVALAAFA